MKLALCLVFCLGLALARVEEWSWLVDDMETGRTVHDTEFQVGREFHYVYNGQMTTGVPGSSKQHSGTRIQALVTFLFTSQNVCLLKLNNIRMGKMNTELPTPRKLVRFEIFEELPIEPMLKEKLMLPIKFTYTNGMINNVVFDVEEQPWSANIKRGIMNMLQVNVQQQQSMDIPMETMHMRSMESDDALFYRVMEETIEGECETLYTVTKPTKVYGREVMNVTKSVNFEKCKKRPEVKYNFRFSDPCPTCDSKYMESEKFLKSSTVAQYGITGTPRNFLIDNARVESEYTFVPFNEESNVILTYVHQTLMLVKTSPITVRIEEPRQPIESDSDMVYTLDWDVAKEIFMMEEDTTMLSRTKYPNIPEKVQLVGQYLERMLHKMIEKVDDVVPKYVDRLVNLFRFCTRQELEQIYEMFYRTSRFNAEEQKKIRDILPHLTSTCGTKACVSVLVEKIRSEEIPTVRAILVLKDLINIRHPSKEIINELLKLTECEIVERHYLLKQSCWLTIGTLMNGLCSNNVDKLAREIKESKEHICPTQLKEQYVQLLVNKLHSTNKWEERLMYMKTLGNAGLDLSVFELEKVIRNVEKHYSTLARSEAVLALRQLRDIMPKKIQKILMPVLLNKLESPTLRITACYMLMQTMPERPILDQIAKMVFHERNVQVASFVYSYMDTLANSTNPCEKKLVTDMKLSLRHIKKINPSPLTHSKIVRIPLHNLHHKIGLDLELASSFIDRTNIPRYLTATLHSNFLGFWNKYLFTFGLVSDNMETLLKRLVGDNKYLFDEDMLNMFTDKSRFNMDFDMNDIFSTLKHFTTDFEETTKEPRAWFYMKFKDQDVGFLPLKEELLRSFLSEHSYNLREIENKMRHGLKVNMNKAGMLHEMVYKIPTTMGMPLSVAVKVPFIASLNGHLQTVSNGLKNFKIAATLKPSLALTLVVDVECWTPIINHGLKVVNKLNIFHPIDAKIEVDLLTVPKNVRVTIRPPTTRRDLVVLESKPITYTRMWKRFDDADEKIIYGEEISRMHKFNKCIGRRVLGVDFCLRGQITKVPSTTVVGHPFFPLAGPNKVVLAIEPSHETPEEIVINLSGKFFETSFNTFSSRLFEETEYETTERHMYNEYETPRFFETRHHNMYTPKKPINNYLKIDVIVGHSKKIGLEMRHTCDMMGRYGKLHAKFMYTPLSRDYVREPMMVCLDSETVYPETTSTNDIMCNARLTWGRTCQSNNYITLKTKSQSTPMHHVFETEMPEFLSRHESIESRFFDKRADLTTKYVTDIEYNNVPIFVKNLTNKLFIMLKHKYYEHADFNQISVRNPENKIRMVMTVDPITKHYVNLIVKTPKENVIFTDVPTLFPMTSVNTKRSYFKNLLNVFSSRHMTTGNCHVCGQTVKTFDDQEYSMPLTTSYKVLVQDCDKSSDCMVMMRKMNERTDLKEVKIVSRNNEIVIAPVSENDDQMKIFVNGRLYPLVNDEIEIFGCKIYREGSEIKVELLNCGITVCFNGYTCTVERCPTTMTSVRLCGLCGKTEIEYDSYNTKHHLYNKRHLYNNLYNTYPYVDEHCDDYNCYSKRRPFYETLFQDKTWEHRDPWCMTDDCETEINTPYNRWDETEKYLRDDKTFWEDKTMCHGEECYETTTYDKPSYWRHEKTMWNTEMTTPKTNFWGLYEKPETTFWGLYEKPETSFWRSHENSYEHERLVTPTLKHKIMETENKICISVERVPECCRECTPLKKIEKVVKYVCMHRDEPEVHSLITRVQYGESVMPMIERLSMMTPTKIRTEMVPLKCTKLF